MKKWLISIAILGGLGYFGYQYAMSYLSDRMMDQVTQEILTPNEVQQLLENPVIQEAIKQYGGSAALENLQKQTPTTEEKGTTAPSVSPEPGAAQPVFSSREEAMKFLLTKFTMAELMDLAALAQGGLTAEKQAQLKDDLLSRLTPEEFQALKVFGLIELSRKQ
ncbi:hypothetical protein [Ammoniphilus sp. YIM 78166]|uniref:hypothetical protein n=1 Tax=Ammoniphilus sp. YIM 78166 TaxID=1644106 RepID=UPI0010704B33|nr:hypothetical protein [Ammoniphilus sp. YIM 78166]